MLVEAETFFLFGLIENFFQVDTQFLEFDPLWVILGHRFAISSFERAFILDQWNLYYVLIENYVLLSSPTIKKKTF